MVNSAQNTHKLTNVQALLLQTFQFDLSETELLEVKKLLSNHFAQKAREEADKLINDGVVKLEDLDKASEEIINDRGSYLKKIRSEGSN
ncbi:hypothetical protein QM480_04930 [Flectobacillus sp. DC10W]|uniref:Uncharacterized protein n=1 Tax=Flectobacillus longus TaxID=2984207 RepID=A0ABT6YJ98_9BACT|nr:hypothetical protein [Flectobacillus longus]MDI9863655.1 hypothetical protein [Flectobacillus longus]